jgi:hypothetical protein
MTIDELEAVTLRTEDGARITGAWRRIVAFIEPLALGGTI